MNLSSNTYHISSHKQLLTIFHPNEVIESYLPMSKKKARKFVIRYLDHKRIGNKIYVDRYKLEELLKRKDIESFPLD